MFKNRIAFEKARELRDRFGCRVFVETGTFNGLNAIKATEIFDLVFTVEINPEHYKSAQDNFAKSGFVQDSDTIWCRGETKIVSVLGNSPEFLSQWTHSMPPIIAGFTFFFLDAHWEEYWPLKDELKAIADAGLFDSVIAIHDFYVEGKEWSFDSYAGHRLDMDYIKDDLLRINPQYELATNEQCEGENIGILYALPTKPQLLCSALTPTANGPVALRNMVERFFQSVDKPNEVEILLRVDNDNKATLKILQQLRDYGRVNWVIGPRYNGYTSMGEFVHELSEHSDATWNFLIDDDAWISTKGWDTKLRDIAPIRCAAQPEFYHLGNSKYKSGSCGPVALMVPNKFWRELDVAYCPNPVDQSWLDLLRKNQWPIHLLKRTIYKHERFKP